MSLRVSLRAFTQGEYLFSRSCTCREGGPSRVQCKLSLTRKYPATFGFDDDMSFSRHNDLDIRDAAGSLIAVYPDLNLSRVARQAHNSFQEHGEKCGCIREGPRD